MTVTELRQYCRQHPGSEMRCCIAVKGVTPLVFGFLGGVLVFNDEVRLEAFKPERYEREGKWGHYVRYTLTCEQLLERLSEAPCRAQVKMCYEDEDGHYCRVNVREVLPMRSMCVLYCPSKSLFVRRFSAMKK